MGKKKPEQMQDSEDIREETTETPDPTDTGDAAETVDTPGTDENVPVVDNAPEGENGDTLEARLEEEKDKYLRLLAEYDNFRKRSQKEKDELYTRIRAETVEKFLPVYDNLERALQVPTADEAYRKGVEMTMTGLCEVLERLGVEIFGEAGEAFDPNVHNAVMHCEDENLGENVLAEVFQKGFRVGEKIVRFAMVRVAN